MLTCLKSNNHLANTIIFPGSILNSTYDQRTSTESNHMTTRILFIPVDGKDDVGCLCALPSTIPAILITAGDNSAAFFIIHFHGNACDAAQVIPGASYEASSFNAHYMIVEYPRYGMMHGYPSEASVDAVARSVYSFVVNVLMVPRHLIILSGRSIGTGPVCALASHLETVQDSTPAAVILQSPFVSLRNAASDLLRDYGSCAMCMLDRWENWRHLIGNNNNNNSNINNSAYQEDGEAGSSSRVIRAPVLFIHADRDEIIGHHHSQMLHDLRRKAGLISELFTQTSVGDFIKVHNFYDYNTDVIIPTKEFLDRYAKPSWFIHLPIEALNKSRRVPLEYSSTPSTSPIAQSKFTLSTISLWLLCPFTCPAEGLVACTSLALSAVIRQMCGGSYTDYFDFAGAKTRLLVENEAVKQSKSGGFEKGDDDLTYHSTDGHGNVKQTIVREYEATTVTARSQQGSSSTAGAKDKHVVLQAVGSPVQNPLLLVGTLRASSALPSAITSDSNHQGRSYSSGDSGVKLDYVPG